MKRNIESLGGTVLVDHEIGAVLRGRDWITLGAAEWGFLLRSAGPKWKTLGRGVGARAIALRLRRKLGVKSIETVRGHGYRLRRII